MDKKFKNAGAGLVYFEDALLSTDKIVALLNKWFEMGISPNITVGSVPSNLTEKTNCIGINFIRIKNRSSENFCYIKTKNVCNTSDWKTSITNPKEDIPDGLFFEAERYCNFYGLYYIVDYKGKMYYLSPSDVEIIKTKKLADRYIRIAEATTDRHIESFLLEKIGDTTFNTCFYELKNFERAPTVPSLPPAFGGYVDLYLTNI